MEAIGYDEVVRMIRGAASQIRASRDHLSKLDSATGDGDHGTAMLRAMEAAEKAVADAKPGPIAPMLEAVAWGIMGAAGGAPGPLLGSFFLGMSEAVGERQTLDGPALAEALEGGLAAMRKQTPAKPGDKTMLDALIPAVEALRAAIGAGPDVASAMKRAADAAARGAEATRDMQARFGKARNLGERSKGAVDPGATSISCIFKGFADAVAADKNT
jgi:dihydroxyacetone kinase-like protein